MAQQRVAQFYGLDELIDERVVISFTDGIRVKCVLESIDLDLKLIKINQGFGAYWTHLMYVKTIAKAREDSDGKSI